MPSIGGASVAHSVQRAPFQVSVRRFSLSAEIGLTRRSECESGSYARTSPNTLTERSPWVCRSQRIPSQVQVSAPVPTSASVTRTIWLVVLCHAICAPVPAGRRAPLLSSGRQVVPFQAHVSFALMPGPTLPPKSITVRVAGSYATAAPDRPGGLLRGSATLQRAPSHNQVVAALSRPPNSTTWCEATS